MLNRIAEILKEQKNAVIITHTNPDGDAYGSSFGLKYALESIGVNADVVLEEPISHDFEFMGYSPVIYNENIQADCVICVDFGELSRCGKCAPLFERAKEKIVIDHHITDTPLCENHFTDTAAAAAAEIVQRLFKIMNIRLTKKIAEPVYIGIMTDSGCCRYSNTTKNTLLSLAELIDYVDVGYVNHMIFDVKTKEAFELQVRLLAQMQEINGGDIHYLAAKKEDAQNEDLLNGLVNDALNIEGTKIGILFKQRDESTVKVSVRSVRDINAAALCKIFGGGGHINAAGCTINDSLENAVRRFLEQAAKLV